MTLENQVCSLELSKWLKELNVKQESLYYWSIYDDGNSKDKPGIVLADNCNFGFSEDLWSAFTVAELVELLGSTIHEITRYNNGEWEVYETPSTSYPNVHMERDKTLIGALAQMLIYLLENHLLNFKKGEKR